MENNENCYGKALQDMSLLFDWVRSRDSTFLDRLAELEQKEDELNLAQEQLVQVGQTLDCTREKLSRLHSYLIGHNINVSDDSLDSLPF